MTIHTPDWVKHAVFYQIFPDRFAKSDRVAKPNHLQPWDSLPTPEGYKGGDLLGVVERLDYLHDLGITAIYFTPIFQSASNHRYHTHDYYQVDPMLGGNEAFRELLEACHRRGMRVVIDGVFNHASRGFFQFNDILENGPFSAYLDWFFIEGWPLSPYDGSRPANYRGWFNNRALPKFNTDNPQVREFLMRIAEHWLRQGIDGWRLDVPFEIETAGFWQEFRQRVKAINPEAYIVGEVWRDARQWLQGDQFDGVMNYLFAGPTIAYVAGARVDPAQVVGRDYVTSPPLTAAEYARVIDDVLTRYDWEIQLTQLNLFDSHDTARLLTIARGDRSSVRLAMILLMTFPGAPSVFYGDEIGLPGGVDPDARRTMPWDRPETWDMEALAYHKQLIALRHALPALRTGAFHTLYADDAVFAFARKLDDQIVLVAVNNDEQARQVAIPVGNLLPDGYEIHARYGNYRNALVHGTLHVSVPARDGLILA